MSPYPRRLSHPVSRRSFLATTALAAGVGLASPVLNVNNPSAWAAPLKPHSPLYPSSNPRATTLTSFTAQKVSGPRWSAVIGGKSLPLITRTELARKRARRTPTPLASFGQITDLHVTDAQSPARMEYVHTRIRSAYRPHESLVPFVINAAVKRLNKYNYGPISGRTLDCVVMTGDGTDNHETIELEWVLKLLSGGRFIANTGHPTKWEGVETSGNSYYWQIQDSLTDIYKQHGFPTIKGFFDTLLRTPVVCPGLKTRWYSTLGNHDTCFIGAFPTDLPLEDFYQGSKKLLDLDVDDIIGNAYRELESGKNPLPEIMMGKQDVFRTITPDKRRKPFTRKEFAEMHHRPEYTGAGPRGHGLPTNGLNFYTFPISERVTGIVLDTNDPIGAASGWMGGYQLMWLEKQLTRIKDKLVVVFSHHSTSDILARGVPRPDHPHDHTDSHSPQDIVELLQKFPNVVAWVNGHTHACKIRAHKHDNPRRSFWEINTPSFTDWPHLGRIIEVVDNNDGTLSLFTTLFEPDVPHNPQDCTNIQDRLASLCRQIAVNDFENDWKALLGEDIDGNTELVLANPLAK